MMVPFPLCHRLQTNPHFSSCMQHPENVWVPDICSNNSVPAYSTVRQAGLSQLLLC